MDIGADFLARVRELTDRYRSRCLWFLRDDYYPATAGQVLRVLDQIERHGNRAAFLEAAEIRKCLSPNSSEPSAA
jgi:hypothetical protein